jgi:uncharacterized repeat protein (TIGR01451 family)
MGLGPGALFLLVVIGSLPASAQVLIDDFSTAQSALSVTVPPDDVGGTASSSQGGAMLGGQRDLVVTFGSGSGSVSAEVTGGDLVFAVVGAMATGNVEATWDGDSDPGTLDPTGLGGADLTTGGASAFRFNAGATTNPVDAVLEVYTDGANASTAALRIPVGAPADLVLAFSELVPSLGSGADLADVGAVVLRLAGADAGATITLFDTVAPGLAATKADALTADLDADTTADPGDTVTYTVTLTNTGGEALSVDLADTVDANTTLVPGSVSSTPIAKGDQYVGFGNVTLTADGTPPHLGLLANDADPDGDILTVTAVDATSERGGTVVLVDASSGTFEYTPPAGLRGVDTFGYTVADDDANTTTGTATVQLAGIVWFVDNTNTACGSPPCGDGTQADPFQTAKQAETASAPGDVIRVRAGDGTSAGYDQGFILKADQRLVGGASDLVLGGSLVEPGAGRSVHTNAAGNVFDLASANVISGVRLEPTAGHGLAGNGSSNVLAEDVVIYTSSNGGGVSLFNHTAGFDFETGMITSTAGPTDTAVVIQGGSGTFDFSGSPIAHDGGGLIDVQGTSGATIDFTGASPTLTNGTNHGILLQNNTGSTITFDSIGDVTTGIGHGMLISTSGTVELGTVGNVSATNGAALDVAGTTIAKEGAPGPITFASLAASNGAVGVNLNGVVPAITVAGTTSVTAAAGISLQASGAVTFDGNLAVTATAGAGLVANNTGLVSVPTATSTINATGGPAVDATNTAMAMNLATLSSTGSAGRGVDLNGTTGSLASTGGSITGSAGTAFNVSGGAPTLIYGGTVTQINAARVVNVENTTGGSASLNAKVTGGAASTGVRIDNADGNVSFADLDLGTDANRLTSPALTLSGGSTGTFTFVDTQIFTSGAVGIDGNNGGVVQLTGVGNRVTTTNGIAMRLINGTSIGANGATLQRVDASNATHGIELRGIGSAGVFEITGDGPSDPAVITAGRTTSRAGGGVIALGSGGTLTALTDGIILEAAPGVVLRNMVIGDGTALPSDAVTGTSFIADNGLELTSVSGLTLDNVMISRTADHGIQGFGINDGLTLLHTEILNAGDNGAGPTDGDDAMDFKTGIGGPAGPHGLVGTVTIQSSILAGMSDTGLEVENFSGDLDLTVTHSFIGNNDHSDTACNPCEGDGFLLRADGGGATIDMVVQDTTFNDLANDGIDLGNDAATNVSTLIAERIIGSGNDGADNLIDTANTNGTMRVRITDLTSDSAHRGTVLFFKADGGATTDITVDTSGTGPNLIEGSVIGDGIDVFIDGDPGTGGLQNGNARLLIRNTEIRNHFSAGITLIVQDMDTAAGSLDATLDDVRTEQAAAAREPCRST